VATVAAAPGAGKTVFASLVFEDLRNSGRVDRMVVLAPRRTLVMQWHDSLFRNRHVELRPNSEVERGSSAPAAATSAIMARRSERRFDVGVARPPSPAAPAGGTGRARTLGFAALASLLGSAALLTHRRSELSPRRTYQTTGYRPCRLGSSLTCRFEV